MVARDEELCLNAIARHEVGKGTLKLANSDEIEGV